MIKQSIKDEFRVKGMLVATIRDAKTGRVKRRYRYKNLNPTVLFTMIANNLTSPNPTNAMRINYAAVGTDSTAPALGNTQLVAEIQRTQIASLSNNGSIAYATGFFNESQGNGTLREAAIFADGTSTANSGVLVSRVIINITKTSSESLTLDWTITIG